MFKQKELTLGQIIEIDRALDDVVNVSIANGRLSYKLGRMKDATERLRIRAEKAQQDLFRSLGEEKDGKIVVPVDKRETLASELALLNETTEQVRVADLTVDELHAAGVYLKPSFYKAMGDLIQIENSEAT